MIAIIIAIAALILLVGITPRTPGRHAQQESPRRQLHLAEAPVCGQVERNGHEYLVVRDGTRVRVVST